MTSDNTVVETTYGPVLGSNDGQIKSWLGIRYAAAPADDLRWRAPVPPKRWTTIADATAYGPVCAQPTDPNIPLDLGAPQGDDCLRLNIWAPAGTQAGDDKPVMVWIHGGAYIFGSASQPLYDGRALAEIGDVVVVTVGYRLGAYGFMDLSSYNNPGGRFETNVGIRDVLFALHWVRDNIAAFGGGRDRVTLFGESAGGGVVTTLLTSPSAEGLFQAAIAQSAPATSVYDRERGRRVTALMMDRLGLAESEVHRMREVPDAAIIAASKELFESVPRETPGTLAFAPIVDGDLIPDYPVKLFREGRSHPVPLIIGTNEHEAALFRMMRSPLMPITPPAIKAMFSAISAEQPNLRLPSEEEIGVAYSGMRTSSRGMGIARDVGFRMPSLWIAEGHETVAPVYMYRFDWATPMLKLLRVGATHATELPYVWGNFSQGPKDFTFRLGGLKTGREVSARMRTRWCNFATHGTPNGPAGEPEWLPYQSSDRACLVFNRRDAVAHDLDSKIRTMWGTQVLNFR